MKRKILVAYASVCGSTAVVAEEIGKILRQAGAEVDVCRMKEVKEPITYQAVVIGTAIRMGKPLPESVEFVNKNRRFLAQAPVAIFSLGIEMREDTPESREKTRGFLAPLLQELEKPVSIAMFGGQVDYSKLSWLLRFFASRDKSGALREGDWRDWDAIRAWAEELIPALDSSASTTND